MLSLRKEDTIAPDGYNRWRVPPAALAIHLSIGMAYGFSVFWLPLSHAVGVNESIPCAGDLSFIEQITSRYCDWKISMLGWMYTLFFVLLGSSAAIWGGWLERVGPRKAGVVSACCWSGGLLISAIGVYEHQLWLLWAGSGVIGGIGLGLGYISPVSTLIKWFPDRRGMAAGMAIMGFGGGAMIGAPLADRLMNFFATENDVGVWQTFVTLSVLYFILMMGGALLYRLPRQGWKPAGWSPPAARNPLITQRHVHVKVVMQTPQFWLVWCVLCLNVTAGIGIIGMASPLLQEIFGGRLIELSLSYHELEAAQRTQIAGIAAGFTGLLSLFNIVGRFFWSSLSDYLGRKFTYFIFLGLGCLLYALIPSFGKSGNLTLFVTAFCIILSMYGGGFATIPAYLADLFGTQMVSAIHGRLLTAWAMAGVFGPMLVNYIREYQLSAGIPQAAAYNITMYILAGLLIVGFLCNAAIRPVKEKYFMTDEELAAEQKVSHEAGNIVVSAAPSVPGISAGLVISWLAVGLPLLWGVYITIEKAVLLFH